MPEPGQDPALALEAERLLIWGWIGEGSDAVEELWNVRGVNLFQGLTEDEMVEVLKLMPPRSYCKGEYIFFAGDVADALFLLHLGTVKVLYITLKMPTLLAEHHIQVSENDMGNCYDHVPMESP